MVIEVFVTAIVVVAVVVASRWMLRHDGLEQARGWWRWLRRPVGGAEAVPALFNDVCRAYRKAALRLPDDSHHGPQGVAVAIGDDLRAQIEAVRPKLRAGLYRAAKEAGIAAPVDLAFRVDRDPTLPAGRWTVQVWYGPNDMPPEPPVVRDDAGGELAPDPLDAADRVSEAGQKSGPAVDDGHADHDLARLPTEWAPADDDLAHLPTDWDPAGGDAELLVELPAGNRIELTSTMTELRMGRAIGCEVRIRDRTVSRDHARLRRDATGTWWTTVCPAATNPVRVDGQPVPVGQPRMIGVGSKVQLSKAVTLRVISPDAVAAA
jgi:hypothetical protein